LASGFRTVTGNWHAELLNKPGESGTDAGVRRANNRGAACHSLRADLAMHAGRALDDCVRASEGRYRIGAGL
jgi:hypothetical protein